MDSPCILILYASSYGQTARIAHRLGERLQARGFAIELVDAKQSVPALSLGAYAAVLVGSSIIARGIQPPVRRFVRDNLATLNHGISAFFQVSASAGSADEEGRQEAIALLNEYLGRAGWRPRLWASMAGAVNFTKYGFFLRWFMKRASAKHGGATDTSRDHEYTDWEQVDQFADDAAYLVEHDRVPGTNGVMALPVS